MNDHVDPRDCHTDIVMRDNRTGLILNNHESSDSPAPVAVVIHQFDRCHEWIDNEYMPQHQNKFSNDSKPILSWK
jgi:hypothetical protein